MEDEKSKSIKSNSNDDIKIITKQSSGVQTINYNKVCKKCIKKEKEFEELIYLKYQIDEKFKEERLRNNLLEKEKETLIKNITNTNNMYEDLKRQMSFKKSEINQLESIINNLRTKLNNINIPIESVDTNSNNENNNEETLNKLMSQINFYGKRNCELESKIISLIEENNDLKKSINLLHIELSTEKAKKKEVKKVNNENNNDEIKDIYHKKYESLNKELDDANLKIENENKNNQILNEQLKNITGENDNKIYRIKEIELNFEKLKNENQKLKDLIYQYENQINYYQNFTNINKMNNDKNANENLILQKENIELKEQIQYYQQQYNIIDKEPKKDYRKEKALTDDNLLLKKENIFQLDEITKLINENNFLKQYYFNTSKANSIKAENSKDENEEIKPILVVKNMTNEQIKDYSNQISDLYKQNIELENKNEQIKSVNLSLQKKLTETNNKLSSLEYKYNELEQKFNEIISQNIQLNKDIVRGRMQNISLNEKNIETSYKNNELLNALKKNNKAVQDSVISNKVLTRINEEKDENLLQLSSHLFIEEQKRMECENKIKELEGKIEQDQKTIIKLQKDKDILYKIIHKKKIN